MLHLWHRCMVERENFARLKSLTTSIISDGIPDGELFRSCEALYALLTEVSGIDPSDNDARSNLDLPSGKAIGPAWAAQCILDFKRTRSFLKGVLDAIHSAIRRFPGTEVRVLYAGCGPFGTLILPLIPLLEGVPVSFTLLEISPLSIRFLQKTIDGFGLVSPALRILQGDATQFRSDAAPHVIVCEMMQAGLQKEPQVAAFAHLRPQLTEGGFFVPEEIRVHAGLLHPGLNHRRMFDEEPPTEEVFKLFDPAFRLSMEQVAAPGLLPASTELNILIPDYPDLFAYNQLCLFTLIRVFGEERLEPWDCALTLPVKLADLDPDQPVREIFLKYESGDKPGIVWNFFH